MANPKVSLYYLAKTKQGWKRYPAVIGGNHRIRPRYAMVNGKPEFFEVGHYELRLMIGGRMGWKNVGEDASEAQAQQILETKRAAAHVAAAEAGTKLVETKGGRVHLADKAVEFEQRQIGLGFKRSAQVFKETFAEFAAVSKLTYADQISESVILAWYAVCRKSGNSARTVYNKHIQMFNFLGYLEREYKIAKPAMKAPKFTRTDVEIFKPEEIKAFFEAIDNPYHRIVFQVLLKTGMRKQEAMFLQWSDINWTAKTIRVAEKNDLGFTIKGKAERVVPVSGDLIEQLRAWKDTHGGRLVLGTSLDTPNWKWLPILKRIAHKAGLNCGDCKECRDTDGERCEHWFLHKFRATWTTEMLRKLRDPRSVMSYSGHTDMKTMLRYLAPIEASEIQTRIESISWGD
jgi:integrase